MKYVATQSGNVWIAERDGDGNPTVIIQADGHQPLLVSDTKAATYAAAATEDNVYLYLSEGPADPTADSLDFPDPEAFIQSIIDAAYALAETAGTTTDAAVSALIQGIGGTLTKNSLTASFVGARATNASKVFTLDFNGTPNPGDGCVGIRIGKDSTSAAPLALTFMVDGVPKFAMAQDYENSEVVILGICTENPDNPLGRIDRLRYDPVTYRLILTPDSGYAAFQRSNFSVHGTDPFPIRTQPFSSGAVITGSDHDSGGVATDVWGDLPALRVTQYKTTHRRAYIDLGGEDLTGTELMRAFTFGADLHGDNTNNFFIFDKAAGAIRLLIDPDGTTEIADLYAGMLRASGAGVDTAKTSTRLNNTATGGRQYGLASGIPGVGEAGFSITDWTAIAIRLSILAAGDVVIGDGVALATSATTKFLQLPSMAGTPTGSVTGSGAAVPIVMDTTAGKMWARFGSTWKSVTFA